MARTSCTGPVGQEPPIPNEPLIEYEVAKQVAYEEEKDQEGPALKVDTTSTLGMKKRTKE